MVWRGLVVGVFVVLAAGQAVGQISSPPPVALHASSGTPLSETFTPSTLFPTNNAKSSTTAIPPPVLPDEPGAGPDGGLFPTPAPLPKLWSGSVEAGLNGASGNSDLLNFRGGWNVRRKSEDNILTSDFLYVYQNENGSTNAQQALLNSRDEILFPHSKWTIFFANQVEYDELRAYRFRVGVYSGLGYTWYDDKTTTFRTRVGAGAVRELGVDGTGDRWTSEMLYGYDFRYKINAHMSVISILDLYPRIGDWGQFRLRARAAYEYVIDPDTGTVLRTGIQDRYDSDPGNAKRNDLTFFTTLGIKF
ncbi:DUF481 domain-containing protein [Fimbriiglobus ruber]|uniref:DUF481 domain-containing protein n=1 Tax=Fimbriiglobus ruber TaxID=1908690 RepID=A0A225E7B8_9BACT|nr:DUF481 domain-containing protein [Fimbriiglobus ruber]OWK44327.1 hypothetical protein FRUB_02259 [Fimbriiglobus ruber]